MKYGAAYIRVSTDKQDEYSPDSQLKLIREYAKKNDYVVPDEFVFFDDGISGRTVKKRPSFNRMISTATSKEHPFDAIFVWKFSRFARNKDESTIYRARLRASNVELISISEPTVEGPIGGLIEGIFEWEAEYYSIRLSEEVKRGMTEKATRGEAMGGPAFGYKVENKMYVPDQDAELVKWIFDAFLNGKGMRQIAIELGNNGVRTKRGNIPDSRFVSYILGNPVYIGKIRWSPDGRASDKRYKDMENVMIVDGKHEPIIEKEIFDKVQEKLIDRRYKYQKHQRAEQPVQFMLKGLLRCSACGSTLTHVSLREPAVQCHKYARGQCTTSHHLSIKRANSVVIAEIERCIKDFDFNIISKQQVKKSVDYDALITAEKEKIKRASAAYDAGFDTLEEYGTKKRAYLNKIEELERQKENDAPNDNASSELRQKAISVLSLIKDSSISESAKNEALRGIIHHITFEKAENNLAIYFYA